MSLGAHVGCCLEERKQNDWDATWKVAKLKNAAKETQDQVESSKVKSG